MTEIRVSGGTSAKKAAAAIARMIQEEGQLSIRVIGAAAVNQAIKAIAIAQGLLAQTNAEGTTLWVRPVFQTIELDGKEISAIELIVKQE